jgi:hypothetical protein
VPKRGILGASFSAMRNLPFPYVTVLTGNGDKIRSISSIEEAAEFLLYHWPLARGEKLSAARQACIDALHGKITCTAARDAFIEAAREANIYVGQQMLKH